MKKHDGLIMTAGALWGLLSLFFRYFDKMGLSAAQAVWVRLTFAAVIMVAYLGISSREKLRIKRLRDCRYFMLTGIVSLALFSYCYFWTVSLAGAAIAAMLLYTAPIFVVLLGILLFGEKMSGRKIGALLSTLLGCVLVTGVLAGAGERIPAIAVAFGIGSGIAYALYSIFGKYALREYTSETVTVYTFVFGSLGILPFARPWEIADRLLTPQGITAAVGAAFLCTVLPYLLYTKGLSQVESGRASILATVEPAVAAMVGIAIFGESLSLMKFLGIVLILSAGVLLQKKKS